MPIVNKHIKDDAVSLEHLDSGIAPAYIVKAAGSFTTVGGDATESISISGATASDVAIVTLKTAGVTPRTITTAIATTNAITVTLSGDPSTDHVLNYLLLTAAS